MTATRKRPWVGLAAASIAAAALTSAFTGTAAAATLGVVQPPTTGTPYGGFLSGATAAPLRLELFEPAIPIPANPQVELNFSHTEVSASSGPFSTALASALWPGTAVGTGLPVILQQSGLPASLANNSYPVQVNAKYPSSADIPSSASQEFLPGMVGRVSGSTTQAIARAGYSTSGQVAGDPASSGLSGTLSQLQAGNIGALGGLLNGPGSNSNTGSNPLGVLSAVVSVGGMSSSSVADYGDPATVTATATSQVGEVDLLGGIVKLGGCTVSSVSSSSVDGGGKVVQKVTYGELTIAGTPFKLTSDGIEAAGSTTAIPGLPDSPSQALKTLGISIQLPKPTTTISGAAASGSAVGPQITIDTQPVLTMLQLGKLPLGSLVNQFPSSANQLKGLLQAALQAHPKIVIRLGDVSTNATASTAISLGGGGGSLGGSLGGTTTPTTGGLGGGVPSSSGVPGSTTPGTTTPGTTTTPIDKTAAIPGLPPLGSVPSLLTLGGLILAIGLGWFFRAAALSALGAGSTCTHGLVTGLPDLRKA